MNLGHGHRRSVLILWAWTALLSAFVLYPVLSGENPTYLPFGMAAIGIVLYTVLHPSVRRRRANGTRSGQGSAKGARRDRLATGVDGPRRSRGASPTAARGRRRRRRPSRPRQARRRPRSERRRPRRAWRRRAARETGCTLTGRSTGPRTARTSLDPASPGAYRTSAPASWYACSRRIVSSRSSTPRIRFSARAVSTNPLPAAASAAAATRSRRQPDVVDRSAVVTAEVLDRRRRPRRGRRGRRDRRQRRPPGRRRSSPRGRR